MWRDRKRQYTDYEHREGIQTVDGKFNIYIFFTIKLTHYVILFT